MMISNLLLEAMIINCASGRFTLKQMLSHSGNLIATKQQSKPLLGHLIRKDCLQVGVALRIDALDSGTLLMALNCKVCKQTARYAALCSAKM